MRGTADPAEHAGRPHAVRPVGTLPRLLPTGGGASPASLAGHLARYGPPPAGLGRRQRESLIAEVARAGLTGRGGAGYPTARKLAAVAAGRAPVVLANGTGAGVIAALPAGACGLGETARVMRYLAGESAGQCGPCRFGLDAIADQVERLAADRGADSRLLQRWLGQVDGRGGCAHPGGVVRLIHSAMRTFDAELREHAMGWCSGTISVLPVPPRRSR